MFSVFFQFKTSGQNNTTDSLMKSISLDHSDSSKVQSMIKLSEAYQIYKPDSALLIGQQAYQLAKKNHDLRGESHSLNKMAGAFIRLGNYTEALKYFISQLKIEEERAIPENIANIYMNIALVYVNEKDNSNAIINALKADSIIRKNKIDNLKLYSLLNLGDIYEKNNELDAAMSYTLKCYESALSVKDSLIIGSALNNLGNIYFKMGNYPMAIGYYQSCIPILKASLDNMSLSECYLGLAKVYNSLGNMDSALIFANQAFSLAYQHGFSNNAIDGSALLSKIYKDHNRFDSAYQFLETSTILKDSTENAEKAKQLENLTIEEQYRQKQLAAQLEAEKNERKEKLQLLGIGILIPIFILFSLYLSRKKVHKKIIEYSGIISLLMLFEYITLFLHPFVAEKTNHSPILEIIIFVIIAALLIPTHHRIEHWFVKRLTSINEKYLFSKQANQTAPTDENENSPE